MTKESRPTGDIPNASSQASRPTGGEEEKSLCYLCRAETEGGCLIGAENEPWGFLFIHCHKCAESIRLKASALTFNYGKSKNWRTYMDPKEEETV